MSELQILAAGRLRRHLGTRTGRYVDTYAFHFIIDGQARVTIGGQTHALDGNWLWTGFPGAEVAFAPSGHLPRLHYRAVLRGGLLDRWLAEGLWPRQPVEVVDVGEAEHQADALLALLQGDEALDSRLRANALERFLLHIHLRRRPRPALPSWVLDVQRRLEQNWNRPVDYAELAARYQMPLVSFRRGFKEAVGQAIHTWFLRQRIARAQELLLNSDADLASIAVACGYEDAAFFSRQFKRFSGLSPRAYRQAAYG